jgi:hypothetical protein
VRRAEILSHRDRFREADVDLAVIAFTLGLDEAVHPAQTLGPLFPAAGVGRVLGRLVQLIEADRNALQQNVITAAV